LGSNSQVLLCANYTSGNISAYSLDKNGIINQTKYIQLQFNGKGLNPKRQKAPHAHFFDFTSAGLFAIDLGTDSIHEFQIKNPNNDIELKNLSTFKTPAGYGPRHLCSNSFKKNQLWVTCELESKILCYEKEGLSWTLKQEINTLSEEDLSLCISSKNNNYPSHIAFHPKREVFYVSNRGHNSISLFEFQENGWKLFQNFPTQGDFPRHFAISECGGFLVCANQLGNCITSMKIDSKGFISDFCDTLEHPHPTCILFN
jgi:6-phosphogluconolactonase